MVEIFFEGTMQTFGVQLISKQKWNDFEFKKQMRKLEGF